MSSIYARFCAKYTRVFTPNIRVFESEYRVQVVSRQKLNCNRENIEVYRVKYDIFSIRIEFLTTNDLDSGWSKNRNPSSQSSVTALRSISAGTQIALLLLS